MNVPLWSVYNFLLKYNLMNRLFLVEEKAKSFKLIYRM